jgi:hypothetical protein
MQATAAASSTRGTTDAHALPALPGAPQAVREIADPITRAKDRP